MTVHEVAMIYVVVMPSLGVLLGRLDRWRRAEKAGRPQGSVHARNARATSPRVRP